MLEYSPYTTYLEVTHKNMTLRIDQDAQGYIIQTTTSSEVIQVSDFSTAIDRACKQLKLAGLYLDDDPIRDFFYKSELEEIPGVD